MAHQNSERRLAENQVVFRKHNERVQHDIDNYNQIATEEGEPPLEIAKDAMLRFNCECSDNNCKLRIMMTLGAYNMIHTPRDTFCVRVGHELPEVEDVILKTGEFNVVQKKRYPKQDAEKLHENDIHNT